MHPEHGNQQSSFLFLRNIGNLQNLGNFILVLESRKKMCLLLLKQVQTQGNMTIRTTLGMYLGVHGSFPICVIDNLQNGATRHKTSYTKGLSVTTASRHFF